jgi:hypothetical protein
MTDTPFWGRGWEYCPVKTNIRHKEILEAINSNLACHTATVKGVHNKEDDFYRWCRSFLWCLQQLYRRAGFVFCLCLVLSSAYLLIMNEMGWTSCYIPERQSLVISNIDSYFGGLGLKSRRGSRLSWLSGFTTFSIFKGTTVKSDC